MIVSVTLDEFIKIESKTKRRHKYNNRPHVVFEKGRNKAICLPPEIADKLGIIPGLDYASAELDGAKVVLRFHRKGGFET